MREVEFVGNFSHSVFARTQHGLCIKEDIITIEISLSPTVFFYHFIDGLKKKSYLCRCRPDCLFGRGKQNEL